MEEHPVSRLADQHTWVSQTAAREGLEHPSRTQILLRPLGHKQARHTSQMDRLRKRGEELAQWQRLQGLQDATA